MMSRAFIKEDFETPDQQLLEFRLFRGRSRFDFDPDPVYSSDDLIEALRVLKRERSYAQLRDSSGVLLLEVS
jgi:hypothetical protein